MGSADHGGTWTPLSDQEQPCWQFNEDQQGLEQGLTTAQEPPIRIATKHNMFTNACL